MMRRVVERWLVAQTSVAELMDAVMRDSCCFNSFLHRPKLVGVIIRVGLRRKYEVIVLLITRRLDNQRIIHYTTIIMVITIK